MSGKKVVESQMKYRKKDVTMGLPFFSEYEIYRTDKMLVQQAAQCLSQLEGKHSCSGLDL